jgi:hypothetical protein
MIKEMLERQGKRVLMLTLAGVLLGVGVAKAQNTLIIQDNNDPYPSAYNLRVHVPFPFYVENRQFAAGEYVIARENVMEVGSTLVIRSVDGRKQALVVTHPADSGHRAKTTQTSFNKYGDSYFLSEITVEGYNNHQRLVRSKTEERAQQKELPQGAVNIAANLSR